MSEPYFSGELAVLMLEQHGYLFDVDEAGKLFFEHYGDPPRGPAVLPLFEAIKQDVAGALRYTQARNEWPQAPGIPWGQGDEETHMVVFPAGTGLLFPEGRWRRLEDGRIEALLSLYDLRIMKAVRDADPPESEKEMPIARETESGETETLETQADEDEFVLPWER